eukprot:m.358405 g.358405  ORF g.358405 m.358405 type:complete len:197 (+) comp18140_c0_seq1:395-985(+)
MADEEFGGEGFGFAEEGLGFGEEFDEAEPEPEPAAEAPKVDAAPAPTPVEAKPEAASEEGNALADSVQGLSVGREQADDVRSERSGWLTTLEKRKTLSRRGGPKERWFVLGDGKLTYASSVNAKPGFECTVAEINSVLETEGDDCGFTILTKVKNLHVTARTGADAALWIASIRKAQKSVASTQFGRSGSGSALLF